MPVHKTKDGKYQYGETGKKYSSKKDAIKQALAIAYSQAKREGKDKPSQEEVRAHISGNPDKMKKTAAKFLNMAIDKAQSSQRRTWEVLSAMSGDGMTGKWRLTADEGVWKHASDSNSPLPFIAPNAENSKYKTLSPYLINVFGGKDIDKARPELQKAYKFTVDALAPWIYEDKKGEHLQAPNFGVPAFYAARQAGANLRDASSKNAGKYADEQSAKDLETYQHGVNDILGEVRVKQKLLSKHLDSEVLAQLGPSYLASITAGALLGRLISGKKRRWWGYGLGALVGGLANFSRRKYSYADNILV